MVKTVLSILICLFTFNVQAEWPTWKSISSLEFLDAMDPDAEFVPSTPNDIMRVVFAIGRKAESKIRAKKGLTDAEKQREVDTLNAYLQDTLATIDSVRDKTPLVLAANVCGGFEVGFGLIIPDRIEYLTPGAQALGCLTIAFTRSGATGVPNIPAVGVSFVTGGQIQRPKFIEGTNQIKNELGELQAVVSFLVPLFERAPTTKIGDLQGFYGGGSVHWAFKSENALLKNLKSGAFSPYVKLNGRKAPEVLMLNLTKGPSDQNKPFRLQGEIFYFGSPWASDGTQGMYPSVLHPASAHSPHTVKGRAERFPNNHLEQILNDPEIQKILDPANAEAVLKEAQELLSKKAEAVSDGAEETESEPNGKDVPNKDRD